MSDLKGAPIGDVHVREAHVGAGLGERCSAYRFRLTPALRVGEGASPVEPF